MKNNYKVWDLRVGDYFKCSDLKSRLAFLINFAVLAPSSHNSQPWRFVIDESKIVVSPDLSRSLASSDSNNRQLHISLGCAIENILVAANYFSLKPAVEYFPQGSNEIVLSLESLGGTVGNNDHLIFSILSRHTNRNKYMPRLPDEKFVRWVKDLGGQDFRIDLLTNGNLKNKVAEIVTNANVAAMDDQNFRRELSGYIRSNITGEKLGMPMFGFGMPTPVSLIAPWIVKNFNVNKASRKDDERLLKDFTPMLVVISSAIDSREEWVKAGQLYEKIALNAEKNGLKTAPMAAAIQIGDFYKELQIELNTDYRPQVFFRIGYTNKVTKHSPRLSSEEVIQK